MSLVPVSLAEVREHLNFTEADGHADDEELWATTITATEMVEAEVGPIRPRAVTSPAWLTKDCTLWPPIQPVLSVEEIRDFNGTPIDITGLIVEPTGVLRQPTRGFGFAWYPRFEIDYTVGYSPIPQTLMDAVKLQTGLLWQSQRGPSAAPRFAQLGGGDGMTAGTDDARALWAILEKTSRRFGFA